MPSPWALASQSLLGTAHVAAKDEVDKIFFLDLDSRIVYEKNSANSAVELTKQQTNFLSILVIAGKLSLTVELIKQWLIELDTIKWKQPKLESQTTLKPGDERFDLLRYRIDRLKSDINKKVKPLKLKINNEKGRWFLETDNSDQDFLIKLYNSVWGEFFEKKETNYTPQGLSKQSKLIWQCLWKYSPQYVHAEILAEILEKEWDKNTTKQIYKTIYKLKQQIKNEPWMIKHSLTGEYALVPK